MAEPPHDLQFGKPSWAPDDDPPQAVAFLKALWTISAQPISAVATAPPSRPERRRAERIGLPDAGGVRVITLRRQHRQTTAEDEELAVAWSHRWVVGGHWRNQYLPSTDSHRLQWIPDHVKRPADKPLVVKPTVFDVRRSTGGRLRRWHQAPARLDGQNQQVSEGGLLLSVGEVAERLGMAIEDVWRISASGELRSAPGPHWPPRFRGADVEFLRQPARAGTPACWVPRTGRGRRSGPTRQDRVPTVPTKP